MESMTYYTVVSFVISNAWFKSICSLLYYLFTDSLIWHLLLSSRISKIYLAIRKQKLLRIWKEGQENRKYKCWWIKSSMWFPFESIWTGKLDSAGRNQEYLDTPILLPINSIFCALAFSQTFEQLSSARYWMSCLLPSRRFPIRLVKLFPVELLCNIKLCFDHINFFLSLLFWIFIWDCS